MCKQTHTDTHTSAQIIFAFPHYLINQSLLHIINEGGFRLTLLSSNNSDSG